MAINNHSYIIIGGSTKCASSGLFMYLAEHPSISRSIIKENRFFWTGDYPLIRKGDNYFDGIEKYDHIFEDKPDAFYRLDGTPDYLYSVSAAKLIKENIQDLKFIFICREPIARLVSWFKYAKQLNKIAGDMSVDEYIEFQLNLKEPSDQQHYKALEQGRYGMYLEKYIEIFGNDKIIVADFEKLSTQPKLVMNEICAFLNIDSSFYDNYIFRIVNKTFNVKNVQQFNKYRVFKKALRRNFKRLVHPNLRKPFSIIFRKFDRIFMKSSSNDWGELKISDELMKKLNEYYKEDKKLLNKLRNLSNAAYTE